MRGDWIDPALSRTPFGEFAASWFETKADLAAATKDNVRGRLRKHILPFFEDMEIGSIRATQVRAWVAQLTASGLAPTTVNATYRTCSQIFEQAVVDDLLGRSPCVGVQLPSERRSERIHFLEPAQVDQLAAGVTERFATLIYAAAYTGMRAGELAALRVSRVNLLAREIDVSESMSEVGGKLVPGPTKTGKRRTIGVPTFLCEMLGAHIGQYPSTDGWVFTMAEGGPIRQRNFYRRHFKSAVGRSGLPEDLRFHDLRHTCAALLIANGRHIEEVKEHLGHSSIRVTSDRYGHLFPKARQALADGLDATFREASAKPPADISRTRGSISTLPSAGQGTL